VLRSCARHLLGMGEAAEAVEALKNAVGIAEGVEVRVGVLEELIEAADTAALWRIVFEAGADLDVILEESPVQHKESPRRFVVLSEALWRLGEDISDRLTRLAELADDQHLAPVLRARASTPLMVYAGQADDRAMADLALQIFQKIPIDDASEERLLLLQMIYEATFGTADSAADVAGQAMVLASQPRTSVIVGVRLRSNAGNTYRAAGRMTEAFTALTAAFADAKRINAAGSAVSAAGQLCDLCLDVGDIERARYWHTVAGDLMATAGGGNGFAHEVQSALLAAADGDFKTANAYLDRCSSAPTGTLRGHRSHVACLQAMLRTLGGDHPADAIESIAPITQAAEWASTQRLDLTGPVGAWLLRRLGRDSEAELLLHQWQESAPQKRTRGVFSVITKGAWPFLAPDESLKRAFGELALAWDAAAAEPAVRG
jgi:hypothetical protein